MPIGHSYRRRAAMGVRESVCAVSQRYWSSERGRNMESGEVEERRGEEMKGPNEEQNELQEKSRAGS